MGSSRLGGWNSALFSLKESCKKSFSLTANLWSPFLKKNLTLTAVYGPNDRNLRDLFFEKICEIRLNFDGSWLIGGDFDITKVVEDRGGGSQCMNDMIP